MRHCIEGSDRNEAKNKRGPTRQTGTKTRSSAPQTHGSYFKRGPQKLPVLNRVENSHLPFRRRERAMLRFRRTKTLQKFISVHANGHNHFNAERHLVDRQTFKIRRSAALAEWRSLMS